MVESALGVPSFNLNLSHYLCPLLIPCSWVTHYNINIVITGSEPQITPDLDFRDECCNNPKNLKAKNPNF